MDKPRADQYILDAFLGPSLQVQKRMASPDAQGWVNYDLGFQGLSMLLESCGILTQPGPI